MFSDSLIVFNVSKKDIETLNMSNIETLLETLYKQGKKACGNLVITFSGYDDIPDEVYEIPEIRKWSAKFIELHPEVFYFLNHFLEADQIILTTLCDLTAIHVGEPTKSPIEYAEMGIDPSDIPQKQIELTLPAGLRERITKAVMDYGRKIGDIKGAKESLAIFEIFNR